MNKRGAEELLATVGYVVVFIIAYLTLAYWMSGVAAGDAAIDQSVVKQVAIILDSVKPGTEVSFDKKVKIEGNQVLFGKQRYSFFTEFDVSAREVEGGTKVIVRNG